MYKDKIIGIALLIVSVCLIFFYGWLMFFVPETWSLLVIKITALLLVGIVLGVLGWVGYTLATTPPPKPIEEIEKEIEQELRKLEAEEKKEEVK